MRQRILLVLTLLLPSACAQQSIIDYSQQDRVALVIIGLKGNTPWSEITSTDYRIHRYTYADNQANDVVLMPVTVGTRFQILELSHASKSLDISHEFQNSPMLNIYKDKIYYYGVVQSFVDENKIMRARIDSNVDQAVIEQAKQKYPDIFKRKPDIQFFTDELTPDLLQRKEINPEDTAYGKYLKSQKQER